MALFAISLFVLTRLLDDVDWTLFRGFTPLYLVLILLLSILSILLYTLEVFTLIRAGGYRPSFTQTYVILTASMSANYVTPLKVGIPLRIYLYHQFMKIPVPTGTALVALEALMGMLMPALISIVGIVWLFPGLGLAVPLALLMVLLVGTGLVLYVTPQRAQSFLNRLPTWRVARRVVRFTGRVQTGLRSVSPRVLLAVAVMLVINFLASAVRLYLVLRILGHPYAPLALLCVFAISITAGNLSLIPMGLGVRDASLTLLLVQLGVPREIALSTAIVQRLFSPGWPLLLGLISTNLLGIRQIMRRSNGLLDEGEDASGP
jgi:uncharacterized protein (TIRG00374 family)